MRYGCRKGGNNNEKIWKFNCYRLFILSHFTGVGGSTKVFDFYVPLHSANVLEVKKQIEPQQTAVEQIGTGDNEDTVNNETNSEETLNKSIISKMDANIYNSFQHPKFVKTEKIVFDRKRKLPNEAQEIQSKLPKQDGKPISHKFQFL